MAGTIKEISEKLQSGQIDPVDLLQNYLDRIEKYDGTIKSFLDIEKEQAMQEAKASSERIKAGKALSIYDGIPVGIKDNMTHKGRAVQCASKLLEGFISPYTATAIQKLKDKGFIPVGRLNMDEFAMGSSTENSAYQVTRNPHDTDRAPGGSSGGSAAAVAADLMPVALGSDTGGSIRQPASFCGITGLKPTYGTVSRYGLIAFASSLDQIGPLAKNVDDAAIIYDVIKGHDKHDSTSLPDEAHKPPSYIIKKLKIGYPAALLKDINADVKASFDAVLTFLKEELATEGEMVEIDLPHQKYGIPVYYLTATSEASANLARFDGVRYGRRSPEASSLAEIYEFSRTQGFGDEVKRRILLGTYSLSSGFYDAFYGKAQKLRNLIQKDYLEAFKTVDAIIMPTSPIAPFKIGEKIDDPVSMYLSDLFTVGASLAGIPALAVPSPFEKLPLGVQIQGPFFSENMLFEIGRAIESKFPAAAPQLD